MILQSLSNLGHFPARFNYKSPTLYIIIGLCMNLFPRKQLYMESATLGALALPVSHPVSALICPRRTWSLIRSTSLLTSSDGGQKHAPASKLVQGMRAYVISSSHLSSSTDFLYLLTLLFVLLIMGGAYVKALSQRNHETYTLLSSLLYILLI